MKVISGLVASPLLMRRMQIRECCLLGAIEEAERAVVDVRKLHVSLQATHEEFTIRNERVRSKAL